MSQEDSFSENINWEKLIGENLINKIGILVLLIGVGIGAKYSIEHDLVSPLTRIVLSYFMAIGLLGFGIKLKEKYENYSAVLVGGAMAILYFVTYIAYDFYHLMPQMLTFLLMFVFTAFTVFAAMQYNRQIIAHIGLVGAYGVPFLLSNGSGNVAVLFSYIAIINIGILYIAFKREWKILYYVTFGLTWLIYTLFMNTEYQENKHFYIALGFGTLFFLIFYTMFLAYKYFQKTDFKEGDTSVLLTNAFTFYGFSYTILDSPTTQHLLGLLTLTHAVIHFAVSALIYQRKIADRNVFYLVSGLVLIFLTIAIPVQLDGNFVTLLWAGEAALLFWIGRTKSISFYENIAIALIPLSVIGLFIDWVSVYNNGSIPIFNTHFLSTALFFGIFSFIQYTHTTHPDTAVKPENKGVFHGFLSIVLPIILLVVSYFAFSIEIQHYFDTRCAASILTIKGSDETIWNNDIPYFAKLWNLNYTILYTCILSFLNIKYFKKSIIAYISIIAFFAMGFLFLTMGLFTMVSLRESYLLQTQGTYYHITSFNIWIRYISFLFFGGLLYTFYTTIKQDFVHSHALDFKKLFDVVLHLSLIVLLSSEIVHILSVLKGAQPEKFGLSIFWGIYALLLIGLGIWKRQKHLRIMAIILFAVTLAKLFLYDMPHLETIAKTIILVSLGVLLLIISFLYNKYKHLMED